MFVTDQNLSSNRSDVKQKTRSQSRVENVVVVVDEVVVDVISDLLNTVSKLCLRQIDFKSSQAAFKRAIDG